jgi:hypothetical protein
LQTRAGTKELRRGAKLKKYFCPENATDNNFCGIRSLKLVPDNPHFSITHYFFLNFCKFSAVYFFAFGGGLNGFLIYFLIIETAV